MLMRPQLEAEGCRWRGAADVPHRTPHVDIVMFYVCSADGRYADASKQQYRVSQGAISATEPLLQVFISLLLNDLQRFVVSNAAYDAGAFSEPASARLEMYCGCVAALSSSM